MTGYVYNCETRELVAIIDSQEQAKIESFAADMGANAEYLALTFSPAFRTNDGLWPTPTTEYFNLDKPV